MKENQLDNIELRSEDVQDILNKVPNWMIRWGNLVILILILLCLLISWFVKYPDVIISSAIITTELPPQKEYARTTGKLKAILVKDNQRVKKDQFLGVIENTANYEDIFKLKSIIDTITIRNNSFYFPIDGLPILFLGDIEASYALFENSYIQYKLNKELKPFSNEAIANESSLLELNTRLNNLQTQKEINKTELDFKRKDLERNQILFQRGVISEQAYENKQLEYAQTKRNYKSFESLISQIKESISNAKKTAVGTKINKVKEEMILLKNVIQSFNQLKKTIREWEHLYTFKSNIDGKISFLNYWNINQTVNQGDLVFTIVPSENSSFISKLKTPSRNSGKIKVGQRVNLKIENYPETEFGTLSGSVKKISLLPDKEGNYLIDVKLPEKLITSYQKRIEFKQEMRGSAEIVTDDLRLIERFFNQLRDVLQN